MENFKNYLEKKNIDEITIFLKNSDVDLLRTIAKRYKIPGSTKKKELIISTILQSIQREMPFNDEPPIHKMTIPQLKHKARELNIDYSNIRKKQALRLAIIKKMKQGQTQTTPSSHDTQDNQHPPSSSSILSNEDLQSKGLPYLKALAKKYKIKVSKLSKNQLIALILEAQVVGEPSKSLDIGQKDISKLKKNELIVMAEEMSIPHKNLKKSDLIDLIRARMGEGAADVSPVSPKTKQTARRTTETIVIENLPITPDMESSLLKDRKMTITAIKKILNQFKVTIPRSITKRQDLIHLLTIHSDKSSSPPNPNPSNPKTTSSSSLATPSPKNTQLRKSRKQSEIVPRTTIQVAPTVTSNKRRKTPTASDIVSLDDIQSPFSPVPLGDLLEEPTEKQLQEELYRCLEFYDSPK